MNVRGQVLLDCMHGGLQEGARKIQNRLTLNNSTKGDFFFKENTSLNKKELFRFL